MLKHVLSLSKRFEFIGCYVETNGELQDDVRVTFEERTVALRVFISNLVCNRYLKYKFSGIFIIFDIYNAAKYKKYVFRP